MNTNLENIAKTVFECVDAVSFEDDDEFMDKCESMIYCDYNYLNDNQVNEVFDLIEDML